MTIDKKWFQDKIEKFLLEDESNKMTGIDGSLMWDPTPPILVGICDGNDPIFEDYKIIIGDFHLTPAEAYTKYCERNKITCSTDNLSVITYILPMAEKTKKENLEYSNKWPSQRWAYTRLFGELCNKLLMGHLLNELKKEGINGVAPEHEKYLFTYLPMHYKGVHASTWSHRHMAFAAGLGSFGICDGFLNEKGKAMRCGSIVVDYKLPSDANKRPTDPYYYCTKCGKCVERCPVNAIRPDDPTYGIVHDKMLCAKHAITAGIRNKIMFCCGLCQVGVPCESGFPDKSK